MDFSQLNPAEQAHMSKLIEKRQVCSIGMGMMTFFNISSDARLFEDVLQPRGKMFQLVL
jgi:hypothetical protein